VTKGSKLVNKLRKAGINASLVTKPSPCKILKASSEFKGFNMGEISYVNFTHHLPSR
jgi:hypothetical protein